MMGYTPPARHPLGRHPTWADTPPGRHSLGRHPPRQTPPPYTDIPPPDTTGYGQQAGGTHPTGVHTCWHLSVYNVNTTTEF